MKLYIKLSSLEKFQELFDSSQYLRGVLSQTMSNVYYIETDNTREIIRLLKGSGIKFDISDK